VCVCVCLGGGGAPLPADIGELKRRIWKARASVPVDTIERVWQEMGCN